MLKPTASTARKSNIKPDWMKRGESLMQTRFSIPIPSSPEKSSLPSKFTKEDNPGPRGVYNRNQRLSFNTQPHVCTFLKDESPSDIGRNYGHVVHTQPKHGRKSILRRISNYNNENVDVLRF